MNDCKQIIQKHGFVLKKKLGQNFITNSNLLEQIVEKAEIRSEDIVIEIGPGAGGLTAKLADQAKAVLAIEIDQTLKPVLAETLKEYDNIEVIFADVMKWDLKSYLEKNYRNQSLKVVANLPYYITTPILMKLLEEKIPLQSITIMVQKEVADRMQAQAGSKAYGALTLAVSYYADAKTILNVPAHFFMPPPKVTSAVIHLSLTKELLPIKQEKQLFQVIGAAFEQRRKTLVNALSNKGIADKDHVRNALVQMGLSETIRGEKLDLDEFKKLSQILYKYK